MTRRMTRYTLGRLLNFSNIFMALARIAEAFPGQRLVSGQQTALFAAKADPPLRHHPWNRRRLPLPKLLHRHFRTPPAQCLYREVVQ